MSVLMRSLANYKISKLMSKKIKSPVEHGGTIQSAWNAGHGYQYADCRLEHNSDTAPVYECVDDIFGYSVWFPVRDIKNIK